MKSIAHKGINFLLERVKTHDVFFGFPISLGGGDFGRRGGSIQCHDLCVHHCTLPCPW